MNKPGKRTPIDIIDGYLAKNLKYHRNKLLMSQQELGALLGVTFQQIQKYEKFKNRISACTLYKISVIFDVNINEFFDGLSKLPNKGISGCKIESLQENMRLENTLSQLARVFNIDKKNTPVLFRKLKEFIKAYDKKNS